MVYLKNLRSGKRDLNGKKEKKSKKKRFLKKHRRAKRKRYFNIDNPLLLLELLLESFLFLEKRDLYY